jgi:hypothetical protein
VTPTSRRADEFMTLPAAELLSCDLVRNLRSWSWSPAHDQACRT